MSRPNCEDYRQLFVNDTPLMDMRAPVEFGLGAFPTSVNRPLMQDSEREAVGTCYKKKKARKRQSHLAMSWFTVK